MTDDMCWYKEAGIDRARYWVCQLHNKQSKFDVDMHPNAPCLAIEPHKEVSVNVFEHFGSEPAADRQLPSNPIDQGVTHYGVDRIRVIADDGVTLNEQFEVVEEDD